MCIKNNEYESGTNRVAIHYIRTLTVDQFAAYYLLHIIFDSTSKSHIIATQNVLKYYFLFKLKR